MIYTLFYSRMRDLSDEHQRDYVNRSKDLLDEAKERHAGFVDIKTFVADDGERLTVARFLDEESQRAWRLEPKHRSAQARGRAIFYESYRIVICEELREHGWERLDQANLAGVEGH